MGGHYYDGLSTDPWTTTYDSDSAGAASLSIPMTDFTMTETRPVALRTVVVHATDVRSGCGVIGSASKGFVTLGS